MTRWRRWKQRHVEGRRCIPYRPNRRLRGGRHAQRKHDLGQCAVGYPTYNRIADGDTNITWEISPDNGKTWFAAGSTADKTYMIRGNPTTPQFETVLDIGCRNTIGARIRTDPSLIVKGIWDVFSPTTGVGTNKGVTNVDGKVMTYWGPLARGANTIGAMFGMSPYSSLPALMSTADGRCGAWAELLQYVLFDQGIEAWKVSVDPAQALKPTTGESTPILKVNPLLPGQGNSAPQYYFTDHAVVELTGRDLATGTEYRSLTQIIRAVL
jgi:hypothetical protein